LALPIYIPRRRFLPTLTSLADFFQPPAHAPAVILSRVATSPMPVTTTLSSYIFSRHGIVSSVARNRSRRPLLSFDLKRRDSSFGVSFLCSQMRGMAVEVKKDREIVTSVSMDSGSGSRKRLVELWDSQGDAVKLERMTVQELRTALRSFGVSSKGRKHELIAALKRIMESKVEGDRSLKVESSNTETTSINKSLQNGDISGVLPSQRCKRTAKKNVDEDKTSNSTVVTASSQEISIQTANVTGLKRPRTLELDSKSTTEYVEVSKVEETAFEIEPWTRFAHKKPQKGWVAYNPRTMRPPPLAVGTKFVKLISWNVNGLRAVRKFNGFSAKAFAQREDFDEKDVESVKDLLEGYEYSFFTCSNAKLGYSGTAIISRLKPLSISYGLGVSDHDGEGRLVTAEFDNFYLICSYVPNSGDGLKRLSYRVNEWDPSLSSHMKELEKSKPVILTGDLNCAHQAIDIYNPAGNKRSAGFTDEERKSFEDNYLSNGFVDTFRRQHPNVVGYTYWGYRHGGRKTNKGPRKLP
ncbi:DNA-(apurinic or apyrimidinic site) endonuclease, chloroplastic-like protein, partial [Drosera capensis]